MRRKQKNKSSGKKREDGDADSTKEAGSEGEEARKSQSPPSPDVDEEGFSKLPSQKGAGSADPWADFNRPSKNFYSSSDESGEKKNHILLLP